MGGCVLPLGQALGHIANANANANANASVFRTWTSLKTYKAQLSITVALYLKL